MIKVDLKDSKLGWFIVFLNRDHCHLEASSSKMHPKVSKIFPVRNTNFLKTIDHHSSLNYFPEITKGKKKILFLIKRFDFVKNFVKFEFENTKIIENDTNHKKIIIRITSQKHTNFQINMICNEANKN